MKNVKTVISWPSHKKISLQSDVCHFFNDVILFEWFTL